MRLFYGRKEKIQTIPLLAAHLGMSTQFYLEILVKAFGTFLKCTAELTSSKRLEISYHFNAFNFKMKRI